MYTPYTLLRSSLSPEGVETRLTVGVLVTPHGARLGRTRLYGVACSIQERLDHTVPVIDRDQAQCARHLAGPLKLACPDTAALLPALVAV
jgi:hypothetical protein